MKRAIYYRLIVTAFAAILLCGFVSAMSYAVYTQNQTEEWLTKLALCVSENYKYDSDAAELSKSAGNIRVTVITPDGTVIADSQANPADMENHADRKEVRNAGFGSVAVAMRKSATLGDRFMYAAVKAGDGNVLRLAYGYSGLASNLAALLPAVLAAVISALVLSLLLAGKFAKTVTNPLEKMVGALSSADYDGLAQHKSSYPEIDKLNEALIARQTNAKQLERQKRDFFSNASHELKTPITSIVGFSEMLSRGMIEGENERGVIISRIETEAKRMNVLINDILTISTLESNAESPSKNEYAAFNFADVVKEAASAISPVKDNTAIAVHMALSEVSYHADRRQIYELCINLIENAVKYNVPGGSVYISLKNESGNLVLTVKDTGIGIPKEYQTRVFERFFRVDYGRNKKVGGTGLGLSIVKHIVGIYGGKISLQSEKEEGTTIVVSLPQAVTSVYTDFT
ncbi:hypothetical protein FACS1894188_08820 [Clostridia bacterium]|nr:hypothetical protein FACS1894188_08820 [Clostridia bacterium]